MVTPPSDPDASPAAVRPAADPTPTVYLQGHLAVDAALTAKVRRVHEVFVDEDKTDRPTRQVKRKAREADVGVRRRSRAQLDKLLAAATPQPKAGTTAPVANHGGVLARVDTRKLAKLGSWSAHVQGQPAFYAMLEGVEDPYNFGYAIRSLYAAGCHGLIVRPRNWAQNPYAEATVARAAAGALDLLPMAEAEDLDAVTQWAQRMSVALVATAKTDDATDATAADLTQPMVLLIGGEKRGLPKRILERADQRVALGYGRVGYDPSLGTVAATSVLAFEVLRQRSRG